MSKIYIDGLNNFDIVYYINLKHRTDRLINITNELNKTNIDKEKINRVEGIYFQTFGILGCAKSHIKTLELFLATPPEIQNCIIFEDDFIFTQEQHIVNNLINDFFNLDLNYDILMLSSNILNSIPTPYPFLLKIKLTINYFQTINRFCV
jgi:GR25 family glycosyltransferase involved in LPS biosynthesis